MHNAFSRGFVRVLTLLVSVIFCLIFEASPRPSLAQDKSVPAGPPRLRHATGAARKTRSAADPAVIDAQGFENILAKYRGKPLLVNFWATWCEPCRHEYPMLNELAQKYAPQHLQVVGVSLDDDGEMILVRRFLARYKPVFPNFRKPPGKEQEFISSVNRKWNGAIPASFFYARDGHQIGQIIGEGSRETYEAAIRSVLMASDGKDSTGTSPGSAVNRR